MCVCTSHLGTESEFLVCLCVVNFVQIYLMWTLNNRKHDRKRESNSQTEMPLAHSFQTNKHFNNFVWCRFSDLKDRIVLMWNRSFNHFKVTANHRRIDQYLRQLICIWFRFVYFILSNRVSGEGGGQQRFGCGNFKYTFDEEVRQAFARNRNKSMEWIALYTHI